jgi:Ser/Thr protein kinase RdoA (MazF antagonist)
MSSNAPALHAQQADSSHVVATVWPDLTLPEVAFLLERYPDIPSPMSLGAPSTRPLSAANTVRTGGLPVFVKRHSRSVHTAADLAAEHALISHLAACGYPTPVPLRDRDGNTAAELSWAGRDWTYEVFPLADGEDRYRGRSTWTPFFSGADARASGRALAHLHLAADGFDAPGRRTAALRSRPRAFGWSEDPIAEIGAIAEELPGLAAFLADRDWKADLTPHIEFHARLRPLAANLVASWTHNDWHASNQFFRGDEVSSVIDFGLSDRTTRVYDIAIALERNTLQWPQLLAGDESAFRLDHAAEFLAGYHAAAVLTDQEKAALPAILPLTQADAALAGIEYYAGILKESAMARWGYEGFLIDHTTWFLTDAGRRYLAGLERILDYL